MSNIELAEKKLRQEERADPAGSPRVQARLMS